jgi:23S rRNA pseudouridine1911/1915/1917 synthase
MTAVGEPRTVVVEVEAEAEGQRIDAYLAGHPAVGLSRARLQRLIHDGAVTVAGRTVKPSRLLRAGEGIAIAIPALQPASVEPEPIELQIIYEDGYFLVIDKPSGMVVHPAGRVRSGTVVNALLHHCAGALSGIGGVERPGIVHRLDKETSGLLVAAKSDPAHLGLTGQFAGRTVDKRYRAIVIGVVEADRGEVDRPIGRHPTDRKRMAIVEGGRPALTSYQVLDRFGAHTHLELVLRTGRTHQIRVHLASVGHPILGDSIYGGSRGQRGRRAGAPTFVARQMLHAWRLAFDHPIDGRRMAFEAPPPEDFEQALDRLRSFHEAGR